jgi:hypothetical protein
MRAHAARDRISPLVRRLGADNPQRQARDEMALEVEGVVDDAPPICQVRYHAPRSGGVPALWAPALGTQIQLLVGYQRHSVR